VMHGEHMEAPPAMGLQGDSGVQVQGEVGFRV